ncbi:MAG: PD40 domain-containing protein [Steroidobacter sp.]|nr:PD40 domain-containing protein [Steroidobacter sp.]
MLLAATAFASDDAWDVTDTGQPYTDAKFTVTEGTWMNLDVSPDGNTLVFDMLGDIYSMPASGGTARLLHGGPALEYQPRFSHDGSKLLYVSDRGGSYNIWSSAADGSQARQVTHETFDALGTPSWAANGRYLVATKYSGRSLGKLPELWFYHLDGGQGRLLVEVSKNSSVVHEPQLSSDGRYLYYTEKTSIGRFSNVLQPIYSIKRRALSDGKVEEVLNGFGGATTAQLSPDNGRIAFVRRVKNKSVLFVYDTRSGEQWPVYDDLERDLRANRNPRAGSYYPQFDWFPNGREVAIWSKGKLYRIDVDTRVRQEIPFRVNAEHRITKPARFETALAPEQFTVRAIQHIAPTPDGKSVTFNALGRLWHKALPNGVPQRLTKSTTFEFEPSYSRDGSALVYVSWDDERGAALELMTTKSRRVRTVLKGAGIIRQPTFSPDGKQLVYWIERGNKRLGGYRALNAGLYWLSIAGGEPHYLGIEGRDPQFSADGRRIYYVAKADGYLGISKGNNLQSVNLDGLDRRLHVTSEDAQELTLSPDGRWLAYKNQQQYCVVPNDQTGVLLRLTKTSQELPVTQLTENGGDEIVWSADSSRLHWMLGQTLSTAAIDGRSAAKLKPTITESSIDLQAPTDKPQGTIAFTNARLITMRGEEVIERGSLVVTDNRIVAVGPSDQVDIPRAAKVIDASGKTLMPGLIDMHGHFDVDTDLQLTPQKHASHYAALAFGVTTNFDPSAPPELQAFAEAELNLSGNAVGPRLLTTGKVIFGADLPSMFHPINGFEDARKAVAHRKALGAVVVKSYLQPMRSQRQQIVKAAREAGLMTTPEGEGGNFHTNLSMILDGHMSVEHNLPVANYYDDMLQLLARGGVSLTPTIVVTSGEPHAEDYFYQSTRPWDDPKIKTYVQTTFAWYNPIQGTAEDAPPYARGMLSLYQADEIWDVGFRSVARTMKKVDDAGGVVTTGAHGQIKGMDINWEMWSLSEGGMSNHRVLRAATVNGAKTIGLDKQIGTLEAGKLADLIVLDANPLENIRNTNTVRYTMVNGRLYESLSMNEIGNYNRPRGKFYWELPDYQGIDWNEAWGGPGINSGQPTLPPEEYLD